MILDIKTLVVVNAAIAVFMAFALLFYRNNYKTYPGFGFWLASTFTVAFVYVSVLFRPILKNSLLSVLMLNSVMGFVINVWKSFIQKKISYILNSSATETVLSELRAFSMLFSTLKYR